MNEEAIVRWMLSRHGEKKIVIVTVIIGPVPVAARSRAWVCGRSPAVIVGSNPAAGMDVCLL